MHRDRIGAPEQLVERRRSDARRFDLVVGDERIVRGDVHAERERTGGERAPDPAEPDDAQPHVRDAPQRPAAW